MVRIKKLIYRFFPVHPAILLFCLCLFGAFVPAFSQQPKVELGVDVFFKEGVVKELKGKRVGLVTNQTGVDSQLRSTVDLFLDYAGEIKLVALFAPEHGINGQAYAWEHVEDKKSVPGIPIYSLHGTTRRPTSKMLEGIDVLVYDIQDIGCRSYTYTTTLFYVMEEAAKKRIPVIVLDRPNPINGVIIDGPMLEEKWRSFIGYVNVPYCHGMTVGELARFFNEQYKIGCKLKVVLMKGWKRSMSYKDTGLHWVPTSPHIPEADSPLFYATTGILGELSLVNIGVGYTLPFKVIGAPWINGQELADRLNAQQLPGVFFFPFHYRPFYGAYKGKDCEGVMIMVTNEQTYRPVVVQYMMLGLLKNLYPKQINAKLSSLEASKKNLFCKANGNEEMFSILNREKYVAWKLILYQKEEREMFRKERKKYLMYQ
ncbi:MAG: DUF1343 domain-containing protein [Verrucomicrobia bacterium]|nr:DUF1343 domain-containing protein [Verrucomicrobiota bacterium]